MLVCSLFFRYLSTAMLNIQNISMPSRFSLWVGVVLVIAAYLQKNTVFLAAGCFFIVIGVGLWLKYGDRSAGLRKLNTLLYRILKKIPYINTTEFFYTIQLRQEKIEKTHLKKRMVQGEEALKRMKNERK